MIFILNRKEKSMKKIRLLVILYILLIAGMANAQQQVSINEAQRAAVQSLNLRQNNLNIGG